MSQRIKDQVTVELFSKLQDKLSLPAFVEVNTIMRWDVLFALHRLNETPDGALRLNPGCGSYPGYTKDGDILPGCDNDSLDALRLEDPTFKLVSARLRDSAKAYKNMVK